MDRLSLQEIKIFQSKILTWYAVHQRDLPWRKSRDPYRILVSEIMLQQTQVSRVIAKYEAWLEAFPTIEDLANAPVSEVLKHWSGLGYNRRALNLKKTAQVVVNQYGGRFPQTEKELLALPGIGQYTARAIMCFAFDQQVSVVDINVKKVIMVEVLGRRDQEVGILRVGDSNRDASASLQSVKVSDKEIAAFADQLVLHGRAYDWNQALMDYSSLMLKKEKIDIPKQSTFKGSRRYYRGQILKLLLREKSVSLDTLGQLIKKDYTDAERELVEEILKELQKEGFIVMKQEWVELA